MSFNLNGATLQDAASNSANLSGPVTNPAGTLQINTTAPVVTSITTSGPAAFHWPAPHDPWPARSWRK